MSVTVIVLKHRKSESLFWLKLEKIVDATVASLFSLTAFKRQRPVFAEIALKLTGEKKMAEKE